jgi:uncharacterized protein YecE (DUF72 family)
MPNDILAGTSGWSYRSWRGPFFPADVPAARRLEYYATHFTSTDLNDRSFSKRKRRA